MCAQLLSYYASIFSLPIHLIKGAGAPCLFSGGEGQTLGTSWSAASPGVRGFYSDPALACGWSEPANPPELHAHSCAGNVPPPCLPGVVLPSRPPGLSKMWKSRHGHWGFHTCPHSWSVSKGNHVSQGLRPTYGWNHVPKRLNISGKKEHICEAGTFP